MFPSVAISLLNANADIFRSLSTLCNISIVSSSAQYSDSSFHYYFAFLCLSFILNTSVLLIYMFVSVILLNIPFFEYFVVFFSVMPRLKVVGHFPRDFKGFSIRTAEGAEFRMDVTSTQGSSAPDVENAKKTMDVDGSSGPGDGTATETIPPEGSSGPNVDIPEEPSPDATSAHGEKPCFSLFSFCFLESC